MSRLKTDSVDHPRKRPPGARKGNRHEDRPKPRLRGPALARGSAIESARVLIHEQIARGVAVIERDGLMMEGERGPVGNPADISLHAWVQLLAKVREPRNGR